MEDSILRGVRNQDSEPTSSFKRGRLPDRGVLALVLVRFIPGAAAETSPRLACGISQVTHTEHALSGATPVALDLAGSKALVLSSGNLAGSGSNGDGLELFLLDLSDKSVRQLSDLGDTTTFRNRISASEGLARAVFRSSANLTGENPDGHTQLFLLDTLELKFHQLTSAQSAILEAGPDPVISGNGRIVIFSSTGDLVELNDDRSLEVFSLDLDGQQISQLTDLSQASEVRGFVVSRDGNRVAYHLHHPLSAFSDIVIAHRSSDTRRVLISGRNIALPLLSGDGKFLFFVAREDFTNQNPDDSAEIFRLQTDLPNALDTLTQLTDFPPAARPLNPFGDSLQIEALDISGDGSRLAFQSSANLLGIAGDPGNSLYVLDVNTKSLNQFPVTSDDVTQGGFPRIFLSRTGHRILTGSRGDPAGDNPDGSWESFLAECEPAQTFFFPQVGSGIVLDLELQTTFMFASTGGAIPVQLEFFDRHGEPLEVRLKEHGSGSFFSVNLNRGRSWVLQTRAPDKITTGYARVSTGTGLTGTGVFSGLQHSTGTFLYEAAVPLTQSLAEFSVVVTQSDVLKTGLAVVNPAGGDPGTALVFMRLYDSEFRLLGEVTVEMAEGQHQAQFVDQIFRTVAAEKMRNAILTVHSSNPLAVVALRQRDDPSQDFPDDVPTLTTFPVAPGAPDEAPPELSREKPF